MSFFDRRCLYGSILRDLGDALILHGFDHILFFLGLFGLGGCIGRFEVHMGDNPVFPFNGSNLTDAQTYSPPIRLNSDNFDQEVLSLLQLLTLSEVHELRVMKQSLDAGLQFDERPEIDDLSHLTLNQISGRVIDGHHLPRIGLQRLDTEGNPLSILIDIEDLHLDALSGTIDLTGILNAAPG